MHDNMSDSFLYGIGNRIIVWLGMASQTKKKEAAAGPSPRSTLEEMQKTSMRCNASHQTEEGKAAIY